MAFSPRYVVGCLLKKRLTKSGGSRAPLDPPSYEGLPGVLGNKGTLAKYRREQGNISQFLGTGEQNSKNYSTKTFGKCVGTWEHRAILEGNKGTRTPQGDPQLRPCNSQLSPSRERNKTGEKK